MQVIAFITIVLLVASLAGINKSQCARITIGSIYGLLFFTIWPYVVYARELMQWSDINIKISFAILCAIATVVSVVLVRLKKPKIVAVTTAVIFVTFTAVSWAYDVGIKNIIDDYYLMNRNQVRAGMDKTSTNDLMKFSYKAGGYSIGVPGSWVKKDDLGKQFIYFQRIQGSKVVAELRPTCINKQKISLGQIVMNLRKSAEHLRPEIECNYSDSANKSCTAIYKNQNGGVARLTRFGFIKDMQKGYDLDFIVNKDTNEISSQIINIISSIQPLKIQEDLPSCLGLAEWF
jgi:hypothetical protein